MLERSKFIDHREGFKGFTQRGAIWVAPPVPPSFDSIQHAGLLALGGQIECLASNWLRWLVHRIMPPTPRRRRILEHI
jgi:hypothetical protein